MGDTPTTPTIDLCDDETVVEWVNQYDAPDRTAALVAVRTRWHEAGHPMSLDEFQLEDMDGGHMPNTEYLRGYLDEGEITEAIAIQLKCRLTIDMTKKDTCVGCYLGDDGPIVHDYGFTCQYGKGAGY